MKNLLILVLAFALTACGSQTPFQRGKTQIEKAPIATKPTSPNAPPTSGEPNPTPVPSKPQPSDPGTNPQDPPAPQAPLDPVVVLDEDYFNSDIRPLFRRTCTGCHGNPAANFMQAKDLVTPGKPEKSPLYDLATGGNGHAKIWVPESPAALKLSAWIKGQRI